MKKIIYIILPFAFFACGEADTEDTTEGSIQSIDEVEVEDEEEKVERKSPRTQESGTIYGLNIDLDYGSPRVKERTIWGELVPYDKVWRAGADEVSAITFGSTAMLEGNEIEAGTYGMFIIPKEKEDWTFILNEEWSREKHGVWGAYDYKKEKDVVRIDVTPQAAEAFQEELVYSITKDGYLRFAWENVILKLAIGPVDPA